jgi:hypothetical protein
MAILTQSSGTVISQSGDKLYISKRPAQWTSTVVFVTGLIAFILWANSVIQIASTSYKTGIILLAVAAPFYFVFWRVRVYRKKINTIPPQELTHIAIIDLENNNLLDGQQNILSPLNQAWLHRKMQITSSSPELIMSWNGGSLSIVKGNPFSGGMAKIEQVLLTKGIRKK